MSKPPPKKPTIISNGSTQLQQQRRPRLTSAPPPWHSVAFIGLAISVSLYAMPSWSEMDKVATVETFCHCVFPQLLSVQQLAYARFTVAGMIWLVTWRMIRGEGWIQYLSYLPSSRLVAYPNQMRGIKTLSAFTSISWVMLGMSFTLSGYIAHREAVSADDIHQHQQPPPDWLLRAALLAWEIAAPFTFLVSSAIRYAIWPLVLKNKGDTTNLRSIRNIFMHNLNTVFALTEVALLGNLPVVPSHIFVGTLVGCTYVIFSWCMSNRWNNHGSPLFMYFFLDTTLPGWLPTYIIMALLSVFMLFYAFFASTEYVLEALVPRQILWHLVAVAALSSGLMRFRD